MSWWRTVSCILCPGTHIIGSPMSKQPDRRVYLDYQASTPVDPRVLETMLPYFVNTYANPHSTEHAFGVEAANAVDRARKQVAETVGAEADQIVFTSGATESNNLALLGLASERTHFVSSVIEHKSVLVVLEELKRRGAKVTLLPVGRDGRVDPTAVSRAIRKDTIVSIMSANNEIGVVQPIEEIADVCEERGALFHTDAAQAAGKIPFAVDRQGISLASVSSHKMYGPKGVGALYISPAVRSLLRPIVFGGGQEFGLRSGTVATPLVVGFGMAAKISMDEAAAESHRTALLRDWLLSELQQAVPTLTVNGSMDHRLPGNLNICIPGIEAEDLIALLPDVALSTGSACASQAQTPSHVLLALGLSHRDANSSVRVSIGRGTTKEDVEYAAARIVEAVAELR
jgi:cysteine desulfurase